MRLRLATRKSPLALTQAGMAAAALQRVHPGLEVELVPVSSQGDRISGRLADHGGKELFVRALQEEMRAGRADAACHSLKDVGADCREFTLAGFLPRGRAEDALVGKDLSALRQMEGPRIGTSSPRRCGMIRNLLPGAQPMDIRGNVGTRIGRIDGGGLDALILAAAGLERLELAAHVAQILPPETFVPAPGQGIVALECLRADRTVAQLLAAASDPAAAAAAAAERAAAAVVAGDCHTPLGAHATVAGGQVRIACALAAPDGSGIARGQAQSEDPRQAGQQAARHMLAAGGDRILDGTRGGLQ